MKKKQKKVKEEPTAKQRLQKRLDDDLVRATWICHYVEKNDPAFIRGYRYGLYDAIRLLDEHDL
jgi:hypothetical protein